MRSMTFDTMKSAFAGRLVALGVICSASAGGNDASPAHPLAL
jgi:hypothetical protein